MRENMRKRNKMVKREEIEMIQLNKIQLQMMSCLTKKRVHWGITNSTAVMDCSSLKLL